MVCKQAVHMPVIFSLVGGIIVAHKKYKKVLLFAGCALFIAGLADLKYKGLFYKKLPKSVQRSLDKIL